MNSNPENTSKDERRPTSAGFIFWPVVLRKIVFVYRSLDFDIFMANHLIFSRFVMCGLAAYRRIEYSTFQTSCNNAKNNCSTASCIRDYVRDAYLDGLFKFCPDRFRMNLMVTAGSWASWANLLEYVSGNPFDCIAYCIP